MLGAAGLLTAVTLLGLVAGLAREWLLVDAWGAGARTDAFLVALFLTEAVRIMLAGGVLSSAALSLWQGRADAARPRWLGAATLGLGVLGIGLTAACALAAAPLTRAIGPGLSPADHQAAAHAFVILACGLPALLLQALWSVPQQAQGRFLLAGVGSLAYNLPAVLWMAWHRGQTTESALAWAFVFGAVLSALLLLPAAARAGLRPRALCWDGGILRELGRRVAPLLGSALGGQGVMLLERMVASWLGEGVLTLLNLARKLANLPLVALLSVNQVLLSLMARQGGAERLTLLRQGLALNTLITTPAAVGLMLSAQAVVLLLFPRVEGTALLGPLLGWYAVALVGAGWNTLLARYNHAAGDTRLPFVSETGGNAAHAVALPVLAWLMGAQGMAVALLLGVVVNGMLLLHFNRLWRDIHLGRLVLAGGLPLGLTALVLPWWPDPPIWRLAASSLAGVACLALLAVGLRPWRAPTP